MSLKQPIIEIGNGYRFNISDGLICYPTCIEI